MRRVRRQQEENRNYKRETSIHPVSNARCLLQQTPQMASVLYTRKYYSDFLICEQDRVPSRGTFPSAFNITLIFTVLLHIRVITPYVTW
jgi:hypothetical protein